MNQNQNITSLFADFTDEYVMKNWHTPLYRYHIINNIRCKLTCAVYSYYANRKWKNTVNQMKIIWISDNNNRKIKWNKTRSIETDGNEK